ncbi:HAD family hydrolase [Rhodoferax mekongensis]|uniref:HAD family phosphatase n=1 Tax=Rhodoferax mekongensis TaxID=3068341 RepID=A0ABZ0AYI8_9BURK|nr:HAD family phosphatase [Rhodoferax sp. TBRC 17307]WNO04716.1 HAD family phosphatase [Rhodoferax sp. TBRC 17307]
MNVVFDFGAVLFTWRPVDLMMECFPQRAATRAEAGHLAHEVFGHAEWQAFDRGTVSMPDVIAQVAQRVGLDATVLGALVESIGERLIPMPESVALFHQLVALRAQRAATGGEPVRLYYLSNMPVLYARTLERMNPFLKEFDGGIFSGDELFIKPEPAIYQRLQNRYALEPAKTVFLDDLLPNIQAAQREGWHGIHFHNAQQAMQALQALGLSEISL